MSSGSPTVLRINRNAIVPGVQFSFDLDAEGELRVEIDGRVPEFSDRVLLTLVAGQKGSVFIVGPREVSLGSPQPLLPIRFSFDGREFVVCLDEATEPEIAAAARAEVSVWYNR